MCVSFDNSMVMSFYLAVITIFPMVTHPDDRPSPPLLDIKESKLLHMFCSVPYFNTSVEVHTIHFMHATGDTKEPTILAAFSDKSPSIEQERLEHVAKVYGPTKNRTSPEDWYLGLEMPPEKKNGTYICNITYSNRNGSRNIRHKILAIPENDVPKTGAIHIDTANQTGFTISQRDVHLINIPMEKQAGLTHLEICQARLNVTSCQAVKNPEMYKIKEMYPRCLNYTMVMDKIPESIFFDVENDVLVYLYDFQGSNQDFFPPTIPLLCANTFKKQNEINISLELCITICLIIVPLCIVIIAVISITLYCICRKKKGSNNSITPSDGNKEALPQF